MGTLGDRVRARDGSAFVGRGPELAVLDGLLDGSAAVRVAFVHGEGGVGKSSLLRELARRAGDRPVLTVDGRDLPPLPEALAGALAPAQGLDRPLVLVDTHEEIAALDVGLRSDVLPALPDGSVVVLASRRAPDAAWLASGAVGIALRELREAEALELLERRGVRAADAPGIRAWAGGSPLALALAAETVSVPGAPGVAVLGDPQLLRRLVDRLAEAQEDPLRRDALSVGAVARVVSPRMLAEVLGAPDPDALYAWLAARSIASPLRDGIALHELARRALRADLEVRRPGWDRELSRRVVDHLHARAIAGELHLALDLGDVAAGSEIRAGWVPDADLDAYADVLRPGDAQALAALTADRHGSATATALLAVLEAEPAAAHVVRDGAGALLAFGISATASSAGPALQADPVVAPWLAHARTHGRTENAIFIRDCVVLGAGEDPAPAQALINVTAFVGAGLQNPRYCYSSAHPDARGQRAFLAAVNGVRAPELDTELGSEPFDTFVIDYGPNGFLDYQRRELYARLGFGDPTPPDALPEPITDLRAVLRDWATADSPTREAVLAAVDGAFGEDEDDARLRRVLELAYLAPLPGGSAAAQQALGLSRSHWFRLAGQAVDRVQTRLIPRRD